MKQAKGQLQAPGVASAAWLILALVATLGLVVFTFQEVDWNWVSGWGCK